MECQDVQQLLAFVDRKAEELDQTEREVVKQHLDTCPACAEAAARERRFDEALGPVLRDVPVPAGLKDKVMGRLTAERGGGPSWKWLLVAGALLVFVVGGVAWFNQAHPSLKPSDLERMVVEGSMDADGVENLLASRGHKVKVPRERFDFAFLQDVDIVDVKGLRVPKLHFGRFDEGQVTTATVLILSPQQFRLAELPDGLITNGSPEIIVHREDGFVHVIFLRGGNLERFRGKLGLQ